MKRKNGEEKEGKKKGQILPATTEGSMVLTGMLAGIKYGIHLFEACAGTTVIVKGKKYSIQEFVKYLEESGLAEKIIESQPSEHEKTAAHMWWNLIKTDSQLMPFSRKETPISQSSNQQKDFLEWAETNRDLIISQIKSGKRGWKKYLFDLANNQTGIASATFHRHLEKFEKSLK